MALTFKTPGVHIIEVTPAGPIEAVGTSTAAFIGPALAGSMRRPTKITGWDPFVTKFGKEVQVDGRMERTPYSSYPKRLYLPIAVRGFFDNGGTVAYVVRVGTGAHAFCDLDDSANAGKALRIEAKREGTAGNQIKASVEHHQVRETEIAWASATVTEAGIRSEIVKAAINTKEVKLKDSDEAKRFRPGQTVRLTDSLGVHSEKAIISSIQNDRLTLDRKLSHGYSGGIIWASSNRVKVSDAKDFRAGDTVVLRAGEGPDPTPPPTPPPTPAPLPGPAAETKATIARIVDNTLVFTANLKEDFTSGSVAIPDLEVGDLKFRVKDARDIERGSVIEISKGGNQEYAEVANVVLLPAEPDNTRHGFLTLKKGLDNPYDLTNAALVKIKSQEFRLLFERDGATERFEGLSMDPDHSRFYQNAVDSKLVNVLSPDEPSVAPPPNNRPKAIPATNLTGGADDDVTQLEATHYIEGIQTLERIDDVNILCAPDGADEPGLQAAVQGELITHCEKMVDRFAILDPLDKTAEGETLATKDPTDEAGILAQRQSLASADGRAALYYPRIRIQNPEGRGQIVVPPSGHVAGIYARVDMERGVHKAPANETINGALGLGLKDDRLITDEEQGELNVVGINVIRVFPLQGVTVWGARTVSHLTAWRYINVRRLFLMVEESIQEGTKWVVFEPNDLSLWGKIKRVVTDFLTRVWRDGGLFGATPEEAFYVKVDEELNPPAVRQLGQVIIEVGIAPVFPAEFVIFRIGQKLGGAEVTELA